MSFASYMKLMLVVGSYAFAWEALTDSGLPTVVECALRIAGLTALTAVLALVWFKDRGRNTKVVAEIRDNVRA